MKIDNNFIGKEQPTFFIADIGANHDGDLERAKELIYLVISNVPEIYKNKKNFWNGLKRLFGESCLENLIPEVLADLCEIKDEFFHELDFL